MNLSKLARIISTIFIPPVNLFIAIVYLIIIYESDSFKILYSLSVSFVFIVAAPIAFFVSMLRANRIVNQDAVIKEQRTIPYLVGIAFLTAGTLLLVYQDIHSMILAFWLIQIVNSIVLIIINKYWKISAHAMGIGSPAGLIYYLLGFIPILPVIIIFLLTGWSRYYLKCHTILQIIAGGLMAFILTYLQLIIYFGMLK